MGLVGVALLALCVAAAASLLTWSGADPSLTRTASGATRNALGAVGANFADLAMRLFGLAAVFIILPPVFWGLQLITRRHLEDARLQLMLAPPAVLLLASAASAVQSVGAWPLPYGLGGFLGDQTLRFLGSLLAAASPAYATAAAGMLCVGGGAMLLIASLGMSLRDVWLLCQVGRPRLDLIARAGRLLAGAGERADPAYARREPIFGASAEPRPGRREPLFSVEPAFELEPPVRTSGDAVPQPSGKSVHLRRPIVRDPEFDRATDAASRAMARRFAPPPAREQPSVPAGLGLFRRRWPQSGRESDHEAGRADAHRAPAAAARHPGRRPVWPGSVPVPVVEDLATAEPCPRGERDELYGRAVALVRAHRKVSAIHLQQSLGIRYMRAADLIERMEREGVVGAPVHGSRPILGMPRRSRIV
jgi:S-DNA-T family DNA segregation ATPase FtsK/SpoIIIE